MKAARAAIAALLVAGVVTFVPSAPAAAASNFCLTIAYTAPSPSLLDELTAIDTTDPSPVTNETNMGTVGTSRVRSVTTAPLTKVLYGVDFDRLGTIDADTAAWTPRAATIGSGNGSLGPQVLDAVNGLAFDPDGTLFGVSVRDGDDLVFNIDAGTGAVVSDAFGVGVDYLAIDTPGLPGDSDLTELAFDPISSKLYAVGVRPGGESHLVEVDLVTASVSVIGVGPNDLASLAFDSSGTAWALSRMGFLYQLDTATALGTLISTLDNHTSYEALDCGTIVESSTNRNPIFDQDLPDRGDAEGTTISLSAAATDPDGDGLLYSATGLPDGLTIDPTTGLITGTITYDAAASSPHAVEITVTDDGTPNLDATDTFTWTVTNTNRNPIFNQDLESRADPKNTTVSLSAAATDLDGDALLYSATGLPPGLSINPTTGLITGTTSATATATHLVTITVTDNGSPNLAATDSFNWTVTNGTPTFLQDLTDRTNAEGAGVTLAAAAMDADGDTLTYSATGLPPGLSINPATGLITGTITFTAAGSYPVVVTVKDGGATTTDTFTWTVANTNRHPVFDQDHNNRTDPENSSITLYAAAIDPDGDILTYSATGLPAGLTINPATGLITGTLTYDAAGSHAVTVTVRDGFTATADSFIWTITNTNRPPVVRSISDLYVAERNALVALISASDPDNDGLTLTVVGLPGWATFKDNLNGTATLSGTPSAANKGTSTVTVKASDGQTSAVTVFTITVTVPNQPPQLELIDDQFAVSGNPWTLRLTATDPEGEGATISIRGAPPWVTIRTIADGVVLSGTPDRVDAGTSTIRATATDSAGDQVTRSFRLEVEPSNRPPTIDTASRHEGREGFAFEAPIIVADADGDPVSLRAENLPRWATLEPLTRPGSFHIVGVAPRDGAGTWPVRLIASDGTLETRTTLTIVLKDWLQPPTATSDVVVMEAGSSVQIRVLDNDRDAGGVPRVVSVGQPENGFARVLPGGLIGYQPNAGFTGKEIFSYTIEDADGQRATATVTVNVLSADVFPVYSEKEGTGVFALGLATTQEPADAQRTNHLGPTEGLSVAFSSSVESLRSGSIYYLLLGVLLAWLLLMGVGRREKSDVVG